MKKLVIDRSRWLRGEGSDESCLLRTRDGKMCCLGFYALTCGQDNDDIVGRKYPNTSWPEMGWLRADHPEIPAIDMSGFLASRNDSKAISDDEREKLIAKGFALAGVEVVFVDGPAQLPGTDKEG